MTVRNTLRIAGVSLALVALLIFATVIVSGWHHHDSVNEAQCPYCHLGHQVAAQPETGQSVACTSALPVWRFLKIRRQLSPSFPCTSLPAHHPPHSLLA